MYMFSFTGFCHSFPQMHQFILPPTVFRLLYIFNTYSMFLVSGECFLIKILICIYLMTNDIRHLVICLQAMWIHSFVKWLFKFLPIFPIGLSTFYFLLVEIFFFMYSEYDSCGSYMYCDYLGWLIFTLNGDFS